MKMIWCLATVVLVRFAAVEAFTSSSVVLPSSVTAIGRSTRPISTGFRFFHHMGDIDHDDGVLPSSSNISNNNNNSNDTALDDASMKFGMALSSMALALFLGGGGFFHPNRAVAAFVEKPNTMVLSAGLSVKDSDIADFSMPSYQAAARAEVNSNLKGDNNVLGDRAAMKFTGNSPSSSSTTTTSSETPSGSDESPSAATSQETPAADAPASQEEAKPVVEPEPEQPKVFDEKAQKAEAKARMKAARARQQAEAEAAAAASN